MRKTKHLTILALLFLVVFTSCEVRPTASLTHDVKEKKLLEQVKQRKLAKSKLFIKIYKKARKLEVHYNGEKLVSYPCVFGFDPKGDKMKEGDGRTPEGKYGIRSMYPHRSWSYFIWVDYPNKTSWERFNKRKKEGTIAKGDRIGGEIGIHGVPEGGDYMIDSQTDWTLGCISLKTAHITDLYKSISKESKMEIYK